MPVTPTFFLPPEVLRLLSCPPDQEEKNWLKDNSPRSIVTTGRAVTPEMPPIRQEVMLVFHSQHQITVSDCETCSVVQWNKQWMVILSILMQNDILRHLARAKCHL